VRSLKTKPPAVIRGVAAILGDAPIEHSQLIALDLIDLPEKQPRKYFDPQKMEQLIASVKANGILEPLLVRPRYEGRFELVAGERRFRAAQALNLSTIPVAVKDLNDIEVIEVALVENLQREDLNPVEEIEAILEILSLKLNISIADVTSLFTRMVNEHQGKVTSNVTGNSDIQDLLVSLGITNWLSFATNRLPLLKLPEIVLESLRRGEIEYTKAKAISRVKDAAQREALLDEAIAKSLSLVQIKERVAQVRNNINQDALEPSLKNRADQAYQQLKRSKVWENPKKNKQIEKLVTMLEALIASEG
jgi:ParB family transcriptional regulator, chromosome partitioning protein